jgi:hypothetical protein
MKRKTAKQDHNSSEISDLIDLTKLPNDEFKKFVTDLIARHAFHTGLAKDLNLRYKWWSPVLLILIPVYSAVLSFLTTGIIESKLYLSLFALVLTVLTILNSIIKPDEKFISSAAVLVQLKDWEVDLALGLISLDDNDVKGHTKFLGHKSAQLSEIGNSMARTYLPQKNT